MTHNVQECVDEERKEQGEKLYHALEDLSAEEKNAVIGYRCVKKDIAEDLNSDLKLIEFENTLDILAEIGVCFINEDDFKRVLEDLEEKIPGVLKDHRSWSMLTVIEISEYKNGPDNHFEAKIHNDEECLNDIPIDLVISGDGVDLVTCKFNVTTQKDSAKDRSRYLRETAEKFSFEVNVCLGTLSIQIKDRIENEMGEYFDEIITGRDVLQFQ